MCKVRKIKQKLKKKFKCIIKITTTTISLFSKVHNSKILTNLETLIVAVVLESSVMVEVVAAIVAQGRLK